MRSRYALVVFTLTLMAAVSLQTSAHSQSSLPDGWESLPADEFADLADTVLDGQPSAEDVQALTDHAWNTFLGDAQFVASGDWATLQVLASDFGWRWTPAADGATPAEVAAFRTALSDRITNEPVAGDTFEALAASDELLASAGAERAALTNRAASWMQQADWQGLPVEQGARLANMLHNEVLLGNQISVRWRGTITAPADGEYTFQQLRQHRVDGAIQLSVNGQEILNTTGADRRRHDNADDFRSSTLTLTAGRPVEFQLDYAYVRDDQISDDSDRGLLFPMVQLAWTVDGGDAQLVPTTVFHLPADAADPGGAGLSADYYQDAAWTNLAVRRVDSRPELIASQWDVVSSAHQQKQEVVDQFTNALVTGADLSQAEDASTYVQVNLPSLLRHCSVEQRVAVLNRFATDPGLAADLSPDAIRALMPHAFMLPPSSIEPFLANWFANREPAPPTIAKYPGWDGADFLGQTYGQYAWVGNFLRHDNWDIARQLVENNLENPDGTCNLIVAYCLSEAAVAENDVALLLDRIVEAVDDDARTGDERATWLLARAYLADVQSGTPRPARGRQYLQEASLLATDSALRFRILQERVARLGALGHAERVSELVEQAAGEFPQQAAEMNAWVRQADALAQSYQTAEAARDAMSPRERRLAFLQELARELEATGADPTRLARIEAQIAALQGQ